MNYGEERTQQTFTGEDLIFYDFMHFYWLLDESNKLRD
jgi:hypothetical protein